MRVVTNERRVKRFRLISQVLFFVSLVILIGGLFLTNFSTRQNDTLLFVPCFIMPIGLLTTLISVRLTNQFVRLPHPEEAIREGIKGGIHRRSTLYNYILPVNHVLVTPTGIYSMTTRFQDGLFKVDGDTWYNSKGRGPFAPLFLFLKQESLGDPFKQAKKDAAAIQALVDTNIPEAKIKVQPVVVFTGEKAVIEVNEPTLPVVYADPKKKPSLKGLLRDEKKREDAVTLTEAQMRKLEDAFLALVNTNSSDVTEDETAQA